LLIFRELDVQTAQVELRNTLDIYIIFDLEHWNLDSIDTSFFQEPRIAKELCDYVEKIANLWNEKPSMELYQILLMVWYIWSCVSDHLPTQVYHSLLLAGRTLLQENSTKMMDLIKGDMVDPQQKAWLENAESRRLGPYASSLEALIVEVIVAVDQGLKMSDTPMTVAVAA
jgi:hypothetical protein